MCKEENPHFFSILYYFRIYWFLFVYLSIVYILLLLTILHTSLYFSISPYPSPSTTLSLPLSFSLPLSLSFSIYRSLVISVTLTLQPILVSSRYKQTIPPSSCQPPHGHHHNTSPPNSSGNGSGVLVNSKTKTALANMLSNRLQGCMPQGGRSPPPPAPTLPLVPPSVQVKTDPTPRGRGVCVHRFLLVSPDCKF